MFQSKRVEFRTHPVLYWEFLDYPDPSTPSEHMQIGLAYLIAEKIEMECADPYIFHIASELSSFLRDPSDLSSAYQFPSSLLCGAEVDRDIFGVQPLDAHSMLCERCITAKLAPPITED